MSVSKTRRRPWRVALPLVILLSLAAAWSGFWFYAVARTEGLLAAWQQREAQAGRSYTCGRETIGGFPFRFELICEQPSAEFASNEPKVVFRAANVHAAAQVYDPTLLIAEIDSPVTIAVSGEAPVDANWKLLQISIRGRPPAPNRASIVIEGVAVAPPAGTADNALLRAQRIELHGRVAEGTVTDHPVLDLAVTFAGLAAPALHPMTREPLEVTAIGVLHGLDHLRPMPLPARLRQLQAAGGRLQIKQARLEQGDVTAVAAGSLGLTAEGRLDGQLDMTVAGLDRVLPRLGIDQLAPQNDRLAPAFDALDKLLPGLGQAARRQAGSGLSVGLSLIGRPAELDGRKALALPLRFVDGAVYLGPVRVGAVAPLY